MTALDRRRWLAGAAALGLAPGAGRAATETAMYDYVFLDLEALPGAPPSRAFAEALRSRKPAIEAAGGEILGLFTPQLGWHARQAALLLRWRVDAGRRRELLAEITGQAGIRGPEHHALDATARPADTDRPQPGGIYVHRWFVVETAALPEFVSLSTQGWKDFEVRFDTKIFGLMAAQQTDADRAAGQTRLLLLTRYGDHGVWEASRDPTTDAMAAFQRRQRLTRDTWAASTLLVAI